MAQGEPLGFSRIEDEVSKLRARALLPQLGFNLKAHAGLWSFLCPL
jgi:hypothetical protein